MFCTAMLASPPAVRLLSSLPSPQPAGTLINLMARVDNSPPQGKHAYRYSVSVDGGAFRIVRDFSQQEFFVWSPALYEHEARVRVTVRNNQSKESADSELPFRVVSRVQGSRPVVTAAAHPLIALFSAPPCPEGSQFRVAFQRRGDTALHHTSLEPCRGSRSNNIYVAGMRAESEYQLRGEVVKGSGVESGAWMPFHTGLLDGQFPPVSVPVRAGGSSSHPILVRSVTDPWRPMATDLEGNVIWYLRSPGMLTRILSGGRFLTLAEGTNSQNDMRRLQLLRESDLAGSVLKETNISRVAEQLEGHGIKSDCKTGGEQCLSGFHHEVLRLPNGHTLALAGLERMFPAGTQGGKEPVDILGDVVVDLDEEFQVAWVWKAFDHLDLNRKPFPESKCKAGPGTGGCPPVFLAANANDWLHSNSLNYVRGSGDLLISMPRLDWVVKIDYRDGKGSGKVLWRLGEGGDFTAKSDDPHPWFSFQHDAGFEPAGSNMLTVLDDAHAIQKNNPKAHTRGQVWKLDEAARTATLVVNADLGVYSIAVGSAQTLPHGGFTFEAGFIGPGPAQFSRSVETTADGKVTYAQQADGAITYRSYRVADLYTAPPK
jgi:hypothetical protein